MTRPARARFSALALVLSTVIIGAGCSSSEPEPTSQPAASPTPAPSSPSETTSPTESATPSETATATATASPSPILTPPTMPPEAEALDSSGASAFFTYWWEEYNYAHDTGDTSRLAELSDDECVFCNSVIEAADGLYTEGGHNKGGKITVIDASTPPGDVDRGVIATAVLDQSSGQTFDRHGEIIGNMEAQSRVRADGAIVRKDDQWLLLDVALEFLDER